MGNVSVPHFGVHLSRKDFDALKQRLKDNGTKYYDEPYLRFKGTKYEQETFFVKDPNENILEIKTLTYRSQIVFFQMGQSATIQEFTRCIDIPNFDFLFLQNLVVCLSSNKPHQFSKTCFPCYFFRCQKWYCIVF